MIIDFHTHITAPEIIARRDEYLIAEMDRAGMAWSVAFGFGIVNPAMGDEELAFLVIQDGDFDRLADESNLYSADDLKGGAYGYS